MSSDRFLDIAHSNSPSAPPRRPAPGAPRSAQQDLIREHDALVAALQETPRASVTALAATLQQPRAHVTASLNHLLDQGSIRVIGVLHPEAQGLTVSAHVSLATSGPITEVARLAASLSEVVFASAVTGEYGLVFEVRLRSHDQLHGFLEQFRSHPTVEKIATVVYSHVLRGAVTHAGYDPIALDAQDETLIAVLQQDGRTSLRHLSTAAGLSPSATKARLERLLTSRVVKIGVVEAHGFHDSRFTMGVGLGLRGTSAPVREHLLSADSIEFAAECVGSYDAIVTISGATPSSLFAELERLRSFPEVSRATTWVHLRSLKEDYISRPLAPGQGRVGEHP